MSFNVTRFRTLDVGPSDADSGELRWDMTNNAGESVADGIYLYLIEDDTRKGGKVSGTLFVINR